MVHEVIDLLVWVAFPYIALAVCIFGSLYRYRTNQYTFSSLSSQFLGDGKQLGIGSLLWHIGLFLILFGHFMAMILTSFYKAIKESFVLIEISLDIMRYTAALAVLTGLIILIHRRFTNTRLRRVTSRLDWTVLFLLVYQILSGFYMVINNYGKEGFWFENSLAPWIRGILTFRPMIPQGIDLFSTIHVVSPFLILLFVPFTRLVHMFTFPFDYMWRSYQLVIWNSRQTKGPHLEEN